MPRPKKRRGFNRRGGLPERPHRLPQPIEAKGPMMIRQDYGSRDGRPGGMSAISEFDADRRRNPRSSANRIIQQANQRDIDSRKKLQYDQGGSFPSNHLGERMYGQEASEIRTDDKGSFVWYAGDTDGLSLGSSDQEWQDAGAVKVYGDFSKYMFPKGLGLDDMIKDDHDYIIRPAGDGSYELDEAQTQAQKGMEKAYSMAEEVHYGERMHGQDRGTANDLLERLNQYKRNAYGNKYEQGGEVKSSGPSIKIPGQYAVDSIKTTPEGNQYVSMELPDGKVVPVFGDWETYGNPNQEGLIEDLDYRIYPLGDGTYALDAGEMESEMLRDESRRFAEDTQGGPGASRMEDLLEKLSDRPGMGFTPEGRMKPVKRQR